MRLSRLLVLTLLVNGVLFLPAYGQTNSINSRWLSVSIRLQDGSFELSAAGLRTPVFVARAGAEIDQQWTWSTEYPNHQASTSAFQDRLGSGRQLEVTFSGKAGRPALKYTLQLYNDRPFGSIQVELQNGSGHPVTVQDIRVLDVISRPCVNLGAPDSADRVLSDSYSEDRPFTR